MAQVCQPEVNKLPDISPAKRGFGGHQQRIAIQSENMASCIQVTPRQGKKNAFRERKGKLRGL